MLDEIKHCTYNLKQKCLDLDIYLANLDWYV